MSLSARLLAGVLAVLCVAGSAAADPVRRDPKVAGSVRKSLDWLVSQQRRQGYWEANGSQYRVAMTALAANAMLCEGSTTTQGRYSKNIRNAVDYLLSMSRPGGLIGYQNDYHYMYGHGFSMLFLASVYGEEEDAERRAELRRVLTKAVEFCAAAQTSAGGWGYVSAKDGSDFDEGSTCITQVQGLRACRNAGIPVSKEIIDRAVVYIQKCTTSEGGVQYSLKSGGGSRPPITAAAVACLFNSGQYESEYAKRLLAYCDKHVWPSQAAELYGGHWHYTHYYFAQVMYRRGEEQWRKYFDDVGQQILRSQSSSGAWTQGYIGPVYVTAINATILQLGHGYLPIYQR
ncbi:MAG: terpene cyclase/mutase family protein [Planctomycetes bacterium]|nr:terpene cyclase/mutase family protein [Planctomycetota bacterium]